ncbi:MAG: 50S ribosomal protein L34e [Candidatus Diapherotrites archaeon]|uniref:50S ribosomal protein L34e n=1 Tax=Candidatus Iainarchaeum sp. TaxID=3101447 RepID=A0A938YX78_9ARCH|nr:50S ribosomal protein L34e [Candidatus Diapherotrites archaeon]
MVKRSDRTKKKKFRRRPSGKSKQYFVRDRGKKHHCAVCNSVLHGVPHSKKASEVKRLSKSQKRPSALFAGTLCSKCRTVVAEEAAKISAGTKKIDEVELKLRHYVERVKVV